MCSRHRVVALQTASAPDAIPTLGQRYPDRKACSFAARMAQRRDAVSVVIGALLRFSRAAGV